LKSYPTRWIDGGANRFLMVDDDYEGETQQLAHMRNGRNSDSYRTREQRCQNGIMLFRRPKKKKGRNMITAIYTIVDDDQKYKME
jgi:hypothetical protein